MTKTAKAIDFEQQLKNLEELVATLESGDLSLEDSMKSFEQGIKVARECQQALKEAEQKVEDNADAENPEKSELIEFDSSEVIENADELPGFGIMAAGASLLFVSRRFRK